MTDALCTSRVIVVKRKKLIDVLLAPGSDFEVVGGVVDGGAPLSDAGAFGLWTWRVGSSRAGRERSGRPLL
jgi:hypothetical protein